MPIKNYTTKVDVFQSLGEIQGALSRNGARKIMLDYDEAGFPIGITFSLQANGVGQVFQIPANIDGVMDVFKRQKVKIDKEQARRTAWRNIRDWVMAQMAFVESSGIQMDELFFHNISDGKQTIYQLYKKGQLQLGDGGNTNAS